MNIFQGPLESGKHGKPGNLFQLPDKNLENNIFLLCVLF